MLDKSALQNITIPSVPSSTSFSEASFLANLYSNKVSLYEAIESFVSINAQKLVYLREQRFTATATQTAFVLTSYTPAAVSADIVPIRVFRNGTRLTWVASAPAAGQFTYSGTTVTTSSSTLNDVIVVEYVG